MTTTEAVESTPPRERWWHLVRDSLRGTHQDYTSGPIARALILLAVPMVLETAMESLFALCDVFYVSRLGSDAVATVGLTESLMTMVYTAAIGLSIGVTAMVARRIGEKDQAGAARVAAQAIWLGIMVAAPIGAIGVIFAPDLLRLMGASPSVLATGSAYTRMMLGGSGTVLLLWLINAIFRGAGDATIAMRTLWLANGINILLAPVLIFGPGPLPAMGVTGAAVATTIGRGIGVLYQISQLRRRDGRVVLHRPDLKLDWGVLLSLVRLSGTGTFQVFVATASYVGLVRVVSTFGSTVLAGYTIGIRLVIFVLLPSWGLANAAATMVGQSLGAGKPDRAEKSVYLAGLYNLIVLGAFSLVFIVFAGTIVSLFTQDPAVAHEAKVALRTIGAGLIFYAYGMVLHQSFNGAGDTWTPTLLNILCFWVLEIPAAWFLSRPLGSFGVYLAFPLAEGVLTVLSLVMFKRGKWKLRKV
ncbi:MAG: MATE family efflux transporter [Gemmatimonadota bacterium]